MQAELSGSRLERVWSRWNIGLTWELTRREVLGRYRGARMGMLWSVVTPFLMLGVYTLAFGFVMKSRWPGADGSLTDFAMILFSGLIVHGLFAECIVRAPALFVGNPNLVKKVVFPLETMVWSVTLSAYFHLLINIGVLVAARWILGHPPSIFVLLAPFVVIPLLIMTAALCLVLSALSVYVRDIGQFVGVLAGASLFLSSAIVPVDLVPESVRWIFLINPITPAIEALRDVAIWGRFPNGWYVLVYTTISLIGLRVGLTMFRRLRRGFGDVL